MVASPQVFQAGFRGQAAGSPCLPDLSSPPSVLIVGLGNPILGDDGFGWVVAGRLRQLLHGQPHPGVSIECLSLGGLSLMEQLIGYDRVVLIDAISSESDPPGTLRCTLLDDLEHSSAGHTASIHDTTLQNAIQVGRSLGAHLPDEIVVVGVTAPQTYDFSEELSPVIAAAVPLAAQMVINLLTKDGSCIQKERVEP